MSQTSSLSLEALFSLLMQSPWYVQVTGLIIILLALKGLLSLFGPAAETHAKAPPATARTTSFDTSDPRFIAEVKQLLMQGNKIAAIKLYREKTNTGLAEAKNAVEAMERS